MMKLTVIVIATATIISTRITRMITKNIKITLPILQNGNCDKENRQSKNNNK